MQAEKLLDKLEKVRKASYGSWMARCPAHKDRTGSLHVTEKDDGRVLIHCHAGCAVADVLGAVGMEVTELFPPRADNKGPIAKPFPAHDVLKAVEFEALVVHTILADMEGTKKSTKDQRERLKLAAERLMTASQVANPQLRGERPASGYDAVERGQKFLDGRKHGR